MNPINHVWDMLGRRIATRQPLSTCLPEYRRVLLDEWCNIPQDHIHNLILGMPRRCLTTQNLRPVSDTRDGKLQLVMDTCDEKLRPVSDTRDGNLPPVKYTRDGKLRPVTDTHDGKLRPVRNTLDGKHRPFKGHSRRKTPAFAVRTCLRASFRKRVKLTSCN
ncbi:transposable element Tcb2 transposase [Trichonephila clavipes]|nr:transposable element Tcb2 transposase [Trichonephila clavipes]